MNPGSLELEPLLSTLLTSNFPAESLDSLSFHQLWWPHLDN